MNIGDKVKVVSTVGSYHDFMGDEGVIVKFTDVGVGSEFEVEVEVDFEEYNAVPFLKAELEVIA
uniref:KOW domain-containing protein n=2 Tax=unclassified bacterial viruses TaxID=12333 RepID=A0AAU6VZD2_9VIRU